MPLIEDIKMRIDNNSFYEYTMNRGSDLLFCQNNYALWQAFEGELKTPLGECRGINLVNNYGSRLYTLIGENIDYMSTPSEVQGMIQEVANRYTEIKSVNTNIDPDEWSKGIISVKITLVTIFGQITENFTLTTATGCD
jgi:phage baseplate assembly protein W